MISTSDILRGKLLIVDDQEANIRLLEQMLRGAGYLSVTSTMEPSKVCELHSKNHYDLILLDLLMPVMDGFQVMEGLNEIEPNGYLPVLVITAQPSQKIRAFQAGAKDFISKPFELAEVLTRVHNLLEVRLLHEETKNYSKALEQTVQKVEASHELIRRQFAQLMESDSILPMPVQKENINQILQTGWHLLEVINKILDLTKVQSGQLQLSLEPVSLAEVMFECLARIEPQAQQCGIKLIFPQFDFPCFVLADRTRLIQILIHLLSNALKYNKPGGMIIVKNIASASECTRISISDDGAGLPPEKLAQIFQALNHFGQESSFEEGIDSLVMTKRLIELMGGIIGAESTVGVGSVFWFELLSVAEPHFFIEGSEVAELPQLPVSRKEQVYTLLYVDDNPVNLKLVNKIIMCRPDIHLLTAVNGHNGIEIARVSKPNVILMDINMPGINGFEALKILHSDPTTAHIPVVAISANAMPLDIEKGLKAGFFRYLSKPIKVDEFIDTLDATMEFTEKKSDTSE